MPYLMLILWGICCQTGFPRHVARRKQELVDRVREVNCWSSVFINVTVWYCGEIWPDVCRCQSWASQSLEVSGLPSLQPLAPRRPVACNHSSPLTHKQKHTRQMIHSLKRTKAGHPLRDHAVTEPCSSVCWCVFHGFYFFRAVTTPSFWELNSPLLSHQSSRGTRLRLARVFNQLIVIRWSSFVQFCAVVHLKCSFASLWDALQQQLPPQQIWWLCFPLNWDHISTLAVSLWACKHLKSCCDCVSLSFCKTEIGIHHTFLISCLLFDPPHCFHFIISHSCSPTASHTQITEPHVIHFSLFPPTHTLTHT